MATRYRAEEQEQYDDPYHDDPDNCCEECGRTETGYGEDGRYCIRHGEEVRSSMTIDQLIAGSLSRLPCKCKKDPYTWIVDDPEYGTVICFGCTDCGTTWSRIAAEPMQQQRLRIQERKAAKELMRLGFTPA